MSESQNGPGPSLLARVLDNTWLLLVLGIVVPTVSYTVWGVVEIILLPRAGLP
jgi:hypothetical protein